MAQHQVIYDRSDAVYKIGADACVTKPCNFKELIDIFLDLIAAIIPIIASLALLVFFWGLVKFIAKAGDEKAVTEGKNLMIWGVVALFVMVSVWGILAFFSAEFNFGNLTLPLLPS